MARKNRNGPSSVAGHISASKRLRSAHNVAGDYCVLCGGRYVENHPRETAWKVAKKLHPEEQPEQEQTDFWGNQLGGAFQQQYQQGLQQQMAPNITTGGNTSQLIVASPTTSSFTTATTTTTFPSSAISSGGGGNYYQPVTWDEIAQEPKPQLVSKFCAKCGPSLFIQKEAVEGWHELREKRRASLRSRTRFRGGPRALTGTKKSRSGPSDEHAKLKGSGLL